MTRFRQGALALPEAVEADHFGAPSFRVCDKIFVKAPHRERCALLKFSRDAFDVLRLNAPELFEPDPGWGRHGWTHVPIGDMQEARVDQLLRDASRCVAFQSLHAALEVAR